MKVGLEALKIFRAREGSIDTREKYPSIYRDDIDSSCHFNPNTNYLHFPQDINNLGTLPPTSPFHCFTLIPETTAKGNPSLNEALYLMQFLNWSIYYYNNLKTAYEAIPKDPKSEALAEATDTVKSVESMIQNLTARKFTKDESTQYVKDTFKKNQFILKPSRFLKLCRFFARAWYEEYFSSPDDAVGSVAFGYYASQYIENDPDTCTYYDGNSNYYKKEVVKMFEEESTLTYQFNDFNITLEKHLNTEDEDTEKNSYSMSVTQFGCTHDFYLFARLYQHRYTSHITGFTS